MSTSVLVVDDDPTLRRALAARLVHWGHRVDEAADGDAALAAIRDGAHALVLLDLALPGRGGLDVLRAAVADGFAGDIVVLTAHGSVETAVEALRLGAVDFVQKPADLDVLRAVVDRTLGRRRTERVASALAERLRGGREPVLGRSPAMARVVDEATRAARSSAVVLVTGESGAGKQVVAELVHARSARAAAPFVYVNCVALADDLVESTLFGHEKGAFTGAVARKEGRIELAAGGTAFLDEIGDTTPRFQTKLLHFLETGQFERVGGTRTLAVDCRIVAATNRDLEAEVRRGTFRADLMYRLDVVRLRVPPLRERPEDVPDLARGFVERFARDAGRGPMRLAAATERALVAYAWPGNVRQLRNVIERMVVLAPGTVLGPELLPPEVLARAAAVPDGALPLKPAVRAFKRDYVVRALERAGGNRTRAADALGIQRTMLTRLLRQLGIVGTDDDPSGTRSGPDPGLSSPP
ncbi:MAG: sigma-54-dependent Fis family transcriptional regulator [Planctomycetia bacterium]|nr:sigma-54-dependent Fis family transcriptional regulator [Planctomycetia bacterium]